MIQTISICFWSFLLTSFSVFKGILSMKNPDMAFVYPYLCPSKMVFNFFKFYFFFIIFKPFFHIFKKKKFHYKNFSKKKILLKSNSHQKSPKKIFLIGTNLKKNFPKNFFYNKKICKKKPKST